MSGEMTRPSRKTPRSIVRKRPGYYCGYYALLHCGHKLTTGVCVDSRLPVRLSPSQTNTAIFLYIGGLGYVWGG